MINKLIRKQIIENNNWSRPAHLIENKPIAKTTIPHIVLDVLRVLVVRQVLQIDNDGIMY